MALAAHILAFLDPNEPERWIYVGWGAAGLLALTGTAASGKAEGGSAGMGRVLWIAASVAWLAGVGYGLVETGELFLLQEEVERASLSSLACERSRSPAHARRSGEPGRGTGG